MGTLHLKFYSCLFPDVETNPGPRRPIAASCRILCSNVRGLSGNFSVPDRPRNLSPGTLVYEVPTARQRQVPRQLRKLGCTSLPCTWIARSECGWVHEYEVPTARQREVPRQLRKLGCTSIPCTCALRPWSQICVTCQSCWFLGSVALSCCAGASCLVPVGWRHMYEMDMEHFGNQNLSVVVVK